MSTKTSIIDQFTKKTILVVGDVMLDAFVRGDVERISPEAPVPVVVERERSGHLGGAGNTAANVASLGGKAILLGVVGNDTAGTELGRLAKAMNIATHLVRDPHRVTTVKTRIAARRHQLLRLDHETPGGLTRGAETAVLKEIARLDPVDFIVVSDYAKGVVTPRVVSALRKRFGGKRIIADCKPQHATFFRGIAAVTPNIVETRALVGINATTAQTAREAAEALRKKFNASVVLTRGEHGMTVGDIARKGAVHIPSNAREVFDVTGAGDTVAAVLALALASGEPLLVAARLANTAAGLVVSREGTTALTAGELKRALARPA